MACLNEWEIEEARKRIGYVFQNNALISSLDVYGNFAAWIVGNPEGDIPRKREAEVEEKIRKCIKAIELGEEYETIIKKYPYELSGGMKKRIAIARETSRNPDMLIYDEPTVGLDPIAVDNVNQLIVRLHEKTGKTSVVITHDKRAMEAVKGRVVFLHEGRVYFDENYDIFMKSSDDVISRFVGNV